MVNFLSKTEVKTGLLLAALVVAIRLVLLYSPIETSQFESKLIGLQMIVLFVAIFFGIRGAKIKSGQSVNYSSDFKTGLLTGLCFAIPLTLFCYFQHQSIDPGFLNNKIKQRTEILQQVDFDELKKENNLNYTSKEAFIEKETLLAKKILSPTSFASFTILSLTILSFLYASVCAMIFKKWN